MLNISDHLHVFLQRLVFILRSTDLEILCVSAQGWIANVRGGGSFSSQGNRIKSSCSLVAFSTDQAGMNIWASTHQIKHQEEAVCFVFVTVSVVSLEEVGWSVCLLWTPHLMGSGTVTQISCHAGEILTIQV